MSRAASENFPVALKVLPEQVRQHLQAIYGYARLVDSLGDEYSGDRSAALDWAAVQLEALFAGTHSHPIFRQLAPTVEHLGLSRLYFDKLLEANRLDQRKTSYTDWDDLLEYCDLSANPVGRLVLAVFGVDSPECEKYSDDVCSALQVLEHLQDVSEDAQVGRIYLPTEDMKRFNVHREHLLQPVAGTALRKLISYEADKARHMLASGHKLTASLRGHARLAVAGFTAGGFAGLEAIGAADFDVLSGLRKAGKLRLLKWFAKVYTKAVITPRKRAADK
ncbi:MAG: squalene synthase HpnC [Acidimicrobiaceae bacterium]|nr:squalene synthase HpnC [Acidimicrobiaceae bacterium]